jgi:hypothetical protein
MASLELNDFQIPSICRSPRYNVQGDNDCNWIWCIYRAAAASESSRALCRCPNGRASTKDIRRLHACAVLSRCKELKQGKYIGDSFHRNLTPKRSSTKLPPLQLKGSRFRNHANLKRRGDLQRALEGMVHSRNDHLQTKSTVPICTLSKFRLHYLTLVRALTFSGYNGKKWHVRQSRRHASRGFCEIWISRGTAVAPHLINESWVFVEACC